jgi:hypothetical protein
MRKTLISTAGHRLMRLPQSPIAIKEERLEAGRTAYTLHNTSTHNLVLEDDATVDRHLRVPLTKQARKIVPRPLPSPETPTKSV